MISWCGLIHKHVLWVRSNRVGGAHACNNTPCDAKGKMWNSGQLFLLVGPHQQSIPQLLSLASRVYKGCHERSTCGFELMRFIATRLCSGAALVVLN